MSAGRSGFFVLGGLVAGFLAGALVTRSAQHQVEQELERAREELQALRKAQEERLAGGMALGLRTLLQPESRARVPVASRPQEPTPGPSQPAEPVARPLVSNDRSTARTHDRESDQDLDERMAWAADTWKLRSTQARAALVDAADLDPEQEEALDALVGRMNQDLEALVEDTLDAWGDRGRIEPREVVDFGVALGTIYQDADDELRQVLTEEQYASALEADFDVFTQIDPEVILPLVERVARER